MPIVAVTANTTGSDRAECLRVGMDDYLCKPHTTQQLREKLRWVAELHLARTAGGGGGAGSGVAGDDVYDNDSNDEWSSQQGLCHISDSVLLPGSLSLT